MNNMLLDTFISIAQDNGTDGMASGNGGTLIELFYTAISLTPDLASLFATSGMVLNLQTTAYSVFTTHCVKFFGIDGLHPCSLLSCQ